MNVLTHEAVLSELARIPQSWLALNAPISICYSDSDVR